jgi:type VI secretion system secreted protein VgrG
MYGPQSALVTGPKGEEIYIDEFGRIKVQFMWDQEGKKDENSSCFIRVMQSFAGNGWGSSFIPRIGHEVIISFLDGDPDRPIVTGSVYNGNNKPPYASKTQSGIKTHSTKEGGNDNYNEIRFEDKKASEQVYIQAEKNLDTYVKHDETVTVDNNQTITVGNDQNITIGNNRNKLVKNNEVVTISNDRTKTVKHDENSTIKNDRNKTVSNNQTENIAKNKTIEVGNNHLESISGNMTISVEKDLTENINGKYIEKVTKAYEASAKTISLEAADEITLKTGSAKIIMKKNGDITISGKNINVKGSGNVVLKGSKVLAN